MSTQDAPSPGMAERYGAPSRSRRRLLVAATVAIAAVFLGWLAWAVVERSRTKVTSELETWSVVDSSTVHAVLVVHLSSDDVVASCRLKAYADDHSTVGELAFTPDPDAGARQEVTIRTDRLATAVESVGCTADGQNRPR